MSSQRVPIVAIVGRPNVGKSTMFNRIIGERKAIVHEEPGLTRDRHYGRALYRNRPFVLIDTGGYEDRMDTPLLTKMREQTLIAIEEADRVLFVAEQSVPNDPIDAEIIQRLRASGKPFFLAVNKAETQKRYNQAISDFSVYGLDMVYPVSALHGEGVYDLLDDLAEGFDEMQDEEARKGGPIHVAIVGRQNVGKSTLTNCLLGENRVIASDVPGTTRDSIDTPVTAEDQEFVIIDTAGIRRRGKIERGAEKLSVHSSFSAIDRADVALLLIDISEGITAQDTHIAGYVLDAGKACILVLNKWDKISDRENYGAYIKQIREHFAFLKWAPILTISARTGQRTHKLWELISKAAENYRSEFGTSELNRILKQATSYLSPPVTGAKQLRIKYVTQTGSCPPTISLFVNDPQLLHFSYERYLHNQFRKQLQLEGTPIRFRLKRKSEPEGWKRGAARKQAEEERHQSVSYEISEDEYEAGIYQEGFED